MTKRESEAERVFLEAIDKHGPGEWSAFVQTACGDDSELRDRVHALLKAHGESNPVLEGRIAATIDQPAIEQPGTMIGPYKLIEEIGEGGMGSVFMDLQKEPVRRKVALKVIKAGMDTKEVVSRFEAERQALALMDHPNIAKVLDAASTDSGRPYFVMELVRGYSLIDYCDRQRMPTRERLGQFIQVCQAVQHAHQKGVIHRDLKPSNVMVTLHDGVPVPKVIDFGIAKAISGNLTDSTLVTNYAQAIGTPLYMSPEQAEMSGLDIDTRSDVYSLGVLLYEMLTGTTPFDRERMKDVSYDEFRRIIREEEPPRPSTRLSTLDAALDTVAEKHHTDPRTLSNQVSGELDWIVMKSLEKDRTRRYESANELAKDVQRYLDDEAVEAWPPSTAYRLRKFARRHKAQFLTVATISAVLVIATVVSSSLAAWAVHEKGVASENLVTAKRNETAANRERTAALDARAIAKQQEELAQRQRDAAEHDLYVSNMHLARHDRTAGQGQRLSGLLNALVPEPERPDFRGWEWYYMLSQVHSERLAFSGQSSNAIAWSPDGKSLATQDQIGLIKIWDIGNGKLKASLKGCPGAINSIAWSPDGKRLAAAGDRRIIVIWDLTSGNRVQSLRGHTASVRCLDWNLNGVRVASLAEDGTVGIWDSRSGKTLSWLHGLKRGFHYSLAWLPDGQRLLGCSGSWDHNALKVWDTETLEEVVSRQGMEAILSPDGSRITSLSGGPLGRVEALKSGELVASFHHVGRNSTTWNPGGERFASSGSGGTIKIWDAETGAEISSILGVAGAWRVAWSPAGPLLAGACSDGKVRVWDTTEHTQEALTLSTGDRFALSVEFSPDGRRLLAGARFGMLKMWDVESGKPTLSVQQRGSSYNWSVAWCPDGKRFACRIAQPNGGVMVYDANTGEHVLSLLENEYASGSMAWNPDGKSLAVAYYKPQNRGRIHVRLWDVSTGQEVARSGKVGGNPDSGPRLAWSPDGTRLAAGKSVWVWDSASGELREEVVLEEKGQFGSVVWSPDGKYIAVGGYDLITIYDTRDWVQIRVLVGHVGWIPSIAWHPHMPRLASGGRDGTVRIWDSSTGQELWMSDAHGSGTGDVAVAWSPDGLRLASAGKDCRVRIWDATAADQFLKRQEREAQTQTQTTKWRRAMQLARDGHLDEAIASFKELSAETPDLPDYRLRLPGVLFDAARQDEAIQMLQQSVAEFPERPEYQDELTFLHERKATQLCQSGQFEEATPILRKLAKEFPDWPDFRAELAFQMAKAERLEETMATFDKLSDAFDGRPDYRPELARQLANNGMYTAAAAVNEQLIAESPDDEGLHRRHARLLVEVADAEARLSDSIEEYPRQAAYYGRRAETFRDQGDSMKALADYDKAIELGVEDPSWYRYRGEIHLERGEYEKALADFSKSIQLAPDSSHLYKRRADALFRLGKFDDTLADLKKVVELNPNDTSTLRWVDPSLLGRCGEERFRAEMIELASQAIELNDEAAWSYAARGRILAAFGRDDKALADLAAAFERIPDTNHSIGQSLSMTYLELSHLCGQLAHRKEAILYLLKMAELQPEETFYFYQAALAQLGTGSLDSYRDTCRGMLRRFQATTNSTGVNSVVWTIALAPNSVDDFSQPILLAKRAVQSNPKSTAYLNTLGSILYRAGQFDEAILSLAKTDGLLKDSDPVAVDSLASNSYFLAMAHHRLGHASEAKQWFDKANEWTDKVLAEHAEGKAPLSWDQKLALELFRREAEAMFESDADETSEKTNAETTTPPATE